MRGRNSARSNLSLGGSFSSVRFDLHALNTFKQVASGILFNVWDAHYRKVTVLRFTQDGAGIMSGSEDSGVSVWSVSRRVIMRWDRQGLRLHMGLSQSDINSSSSLLANELQHETPTPYWSLSDHTLPITDIICGIGTFPSCRILTASIDHSVKVSTSRILVLASLYCKED